MTRSENFVFNVARLSGANIAATGLTVLLAPILLRIFPPTEFGVAGVFTSVVMIGSVFACLGYESAIVLPDRDGDAAHLMGLCFLLSTVIGGVGLLILVLFGRVIGTWSAASGLAPYLWLIPPAVFLWGIYIAAYNWYLREKRVGHLAWITMVVSATRNGSKLAFGLAGIVSAAGLIWGHLLGSLVAAASLLGGVGRQVISLPRQMNRSVIIRMARRYKNMPLFNTWISLINTLSSHLPPLLLAFLFSPAAAGFYVLGLNLVKMPVDLVGKAIAQVFYREAAEAYSAGTLAVVVERIYKNLIPLGMFPFLVLMVAGKDIFQVVFGARWGEAGVYVQILALWIFFVFLTLPLSLIFNVLEKQRHLLVFNVILLAARIGALLAGAVWGGARMALALFSVVGALAFCYLLFWLLNRTGVRIATSVGYMIRYFALALPFLAALGAGKIWIMHPMAFLGLGLALLAAYFILLLRLNPVLRKIILALRWKDGHSTSA